MGSLVGEMLIAENFYWVVFVYSCVIPKWNANKYHQKAKFTKQLIL
jgi:hypothetical protein